MLKLRTVETIVGFFMLVGLLAFVALAVKVSGLSGYVGAASYSVSADFSNIGGLKVRAPVTMAGVRIGEVTRIDLDNTQFKAHVIMDIHADQNRIPSDSSAKILTQGLLGSNYIAISPGFNEPPQILKNGSKIDETHPALILENLIGQLIFNVNKNKKSNKAKP